MTFIYPSKIDLLHTHPTPLEKIEQLFPNREVYCKREDLTGTLLTGNKVRKLEFCLYEALQQHADTLITVGGTQSNHARCTAAVAAKFGLKCILLLREGENQNKPEGNLLLDHLLGAEIHWLPKKEYPQHSQHLTHLAEEVNARGGHPYIIAEGCSSAIGSLGYIAVVEELLQQAPPFDYIFTAIGSGGTFAGLYAGTRLFCPETQVVGFNVYRTASYFQERIYGLLQEMNQKFLTPLPNSPQDLKIQDGFVGPGYAQIGAKEKECIRRVARQSGLILDPAYTSKAFLGMEAFLETLPTTTRVLFLHTGGIFGLMVTHLDLFSD